jgi:putative membrane protein
VREDGCGAPARPATYNQPMLITLLGNLVRGLLMGAADVVPGVSGGTVALVLGIYRRLVDSIRSGSSALGWFARADIRGGFDWLRRVEWLFLVPLLAGIVIAVGSLASVIETQLHDRPVQVAALFLGLVLSSMIVAWRLLERRDLPRLAIIAIVGVSLFVLLGLREGLSEETVAQADDAAAWTFFASGAVAICAMILPGISGSLILVMLGMYGPVLNAVTDRDFGLLALFIAGATLGLALFSQLLHWALHRHYDSVMAVLIGLMAGSTRVLWPWPNGLNGTNLGAPDGERLSALLLMALGLVLVLVVNEVAHRIERRSAAAEVDDLRAS